jgi:uncharacterized membrane protein YdfJ with MMPL/SSD domain
MAAMARWCFRHRAWVLVGWLALLVILGAGGRMAGSADAESLTLPGTGSSAAQNLIGQAFPGHAGDQDTIVWRAGSTGGVPAPAVQARITAMLAKVAAAPAVASVTSPYAARGAAQISRNGQIAYATVGFGAQANKLAKQDVIRVVNLAEAARAPGLQVELGGPAVENDLRPSIGITAAVGVIAAGVVLFIAFGSLLAMLVPLAVAIAGLFSGLMAVGLASHAVSIPSIGPELGILIGLGVGIDYALFIVTRHRANLKAGMTPAEAAARLGQALGPDKYAGDGMPVQMPAFMARLDHLEPRRFPDEHGQVASVVGRPGQETGHAELLLGQVQQRRLVIGPVFALLEAATSRSRPPRRVSWRRNRASLPSSIPPPRRFQVAAVRITAPPAGQAAR